MKSMTAFSRQDKTEGEYELSWEIRTVNHRYLDISLHLPEVFNPDEHIFKDQVQQSLGRGKFDAKLTYKKTANDASQEFIIDEEKVKSLIDARHKIESLTDSSMEISMMEVLNWPGVLKKSENNNTQNLSKEVKDLLSDALFELIKMRELEGGRLSNLISSRCNSVIEIVKNVRARRLIVKSALREKVLKKLSEIDTDIDNNRLEQELVYQAQRLDVDEELDRLDGHIEEVQSVLKRNEPVGRRLDFLMQELNREANTLASKSNDVETTKSAVELKVLIEQMREQVMNIE